MIFSKKKQDKKIVLVQGSLSPTSKTSRLIAVAAEMLARKNIVHEILDIRSFDMDFCDGRSFDRYNADTQKTFEIMSSAGGYILGMPVYSHSISGALKNLIEITSPAMTKKAVGVICNSDGIRSYLASVDLLKVLSYEAHAIPIQPVVHTYPESFHGEDIYDEQIFELLEEMIGCLFKHALPLK
jgi:FAD reductase [NAD(P)H]